MPLVSIVVPCYNEEAVLPAFLEECGRVALDMHVAQGLDFEFVFVDDGSKDGTLAALRQARPAGEGCRVRWVSFSRNFGKEAAIYAGLAAARGDYVALMDADLQDPPALLPEMYDRMQTTGCDCVATRRSNRKGEAPLRSALSRAFYRIINALSDVEFVSGERDYRLMRRPVVDAILALGERNRFTKGFYGWVGFDTEWISYENVERRAGDTKWSMAGLFRYALNGIMGFSTTPLQVASLGSLVLFAMLIVAVAFIVVRYVMFGDAVAGWASTACIILFVGSLQLFCLGVMGQYLAKTYLEAKGRPLYIVKETSDE